MKNKMSELSIRVLVVDDNRDICANIGEYLESLGHIVNYAYDGRAALQLIQMEDVDVVVLDVMMPGMDGLTFCQKLRQEPNISLPVIMLTALDTLTGKLTGFDVGADDYLVKPFALQELHARIQALYRRRTAKVNDIIQLGDLVLNKRAREAFRNGKPLDLNPVCLKLLTLLMEASPSTVLKSDLEMLVWGDDPPDSDALRSHFYKLRQIVDKPFDIPLIITVPKVGYRIKVQDDTE